MKDNILEIVDLVVEYHTDEAVIHAVNGVNLNVKKGETIGLVGETGAGKTTIARAILQVLQTPPAKLCNGKIMFEGQDLMELSDQQMRKIRGDKIAMIFQDPMTALNPIERIGFQIAEAIGLHNKVSRIEAEKRACDMLEMVGIPATRYKEFPHQFSGGMKQRVVIAIALSCEPELLIADEPTTALDVTIQAQVLAMIDSLRERLGMAMILITHDLGIVAQTCDKVAVMYAGEIIEAGALEEIFTGENRHPYTVGLFEAIPNLKVETKRLSPIAGLMPDPSNLPEGCYFYERCPKAMEICRDVHPKLSDEAGHPIACHLFSSSTKSEVSK